MIAFGMGILILMAILIVMSLRATRIPWRPLSRLQITNAQWRADTPVAVNERLLAERVDLAFNTLGMVTEWNVEELRSALSGVRIIVLDEVSNDSCPCDPALRVVYTSGPGFDSVAHGLAHIAEYRIEGSTRLSPLSHEWEHSIASAISIYERAAK